jgi:hypothetical protein
VEGGMLLLLLLLLLLLIAFVATEVALSLDEEEFMVLNAYTTYLLYNSTHSKSSIF